MKAPSLKYLRQGLDRHEPEICALANCKRPAESIDGTRKVWDHDVPLCSRHWEKRDRIVFGEDA